jgi:hypothetical protein
MWRNDRLCKTVPTVLARCTVCSRTAKASQFTMAMPTRLLQLIMLELAHSSCTPLIPLTRGEDGPEYYMTQVEGWDLTRNINTFREAATAFRNARDWAQEQRYTLITAANERARSTNPAPTRTERMTYPDWLATLDEAQEPPASNQDSAAGHAYTTPSNFDSSIYNSPSNTYPVQHTDSSAFDSSTYNGPSNTYPLQHTDSSTFDSSAYNDPSNHIPSSTHRLFNFRLVCIQRPLKHVLYSRV